jgi:NADH:ubiquinone oxidoreductase subunit 6 (subunit J)
MPTSEIVLNGVFYVLAIAAVAGAVAVATSRNIVRSAFALLAVLFSAAALYAVMKADFIAAAQVLIYVGGILVLIIFAVMLTHRITDVKLSNDSTPGPATFCACLCLLFSLVVVILFTAKWQRDPENVVVRSEGNEIKLRQYQADGSTGLARGGIAVEDAVVLEVLLDRPVGHLDLLEVYAWMGDKDKPTASKSVKVPFDPTSMRARLEDLKEGDWRWAIRVLGPEKEKAPEKGAESEKESKPVYVGAPGDKPDFSVSRGITEPVARALAGDYLFAFEAVSVLLLAALVGAAFLARKEVRE